MINTNIDLGVVASLELTFNNIDIIKKLFGVKPVFIHRIVPFTINYDEQGECFDSGILNLLTGLKNEDEFKIKAATIAEFNENSEDPHLRRKIKYLDLQNDKDKLLMSNYKQKDTVYNHFNVNQLIFDFFYKFSYLDANFDSYEKNSYDTICNLNSFTNNIRECVDYFKTLGVKEDQLIISNYNVLNM